MTDEIDKILSIIISLLILSNALLMKKITKNWLHPAVIFSFFWFGYTFFPLVFVFSAPINYLSILYIYICILFFSLSSFLFNWGKALQANELKLRTPIHYNTSFFYHVFYACQIIVLIAIPLNLLEQGFSLSNFSTDFFATSNEYLANKYSGDLKANIFKTISTILNYVGVSIGGLLFLNSKHKIKTLFFSFSPSMLFMIAYTDKGTLFLAFFLFYAGILVTRIHQNNLVLTTKKTNLIIVLLVITIILPATISSFISRGLYTLDSSTMIETITSYFYSYAFGHLYAFSDWFTDFYALGLSLSAYSHPNDLSYGFYTFMSIFKALGSDIVVVDGVFDEYYNFNNFIKSNIYTMFRGLIMDFGLLGSFLFMTILGGLCNISYYFMLVSKNPTFSIAMFVVMVGAFYTSYIISIFIWNSIFGLLLALTAILIINKKYKALS